MITQTLPATASSMALPLLFIALLAINFAIERVILARCRASGGRSPILYMALTVLSVSCSAAFAAGLALCSGSHGRSMAALFTTVYVVEFALSVDNLFVFLLIFKSFRVADAHARRVLTWGILGAVVLRGLFIVLGAGLFARFDWLFYGVGLFLIFSGIKLLLPHGEEQQDMHAHWAVRYGQRFLPMASPQVLSAPSTAGKFAVREGRRLKMTPLFLVLVAIEASDVVFALDSVPASFAITQRVDLVFYANMFAVMGLRSLYALLAHAAQALRYLHIGLAAILMLIGCKMLLRHAFEVPDMVFLGLVLTILATSAGASVLFPAKTQHL